MSKVLWKSLLITPIGLAAMVAASASTRAAEIQVQTQVAPTEPLTELSQSSATFSVKSSRQTSTKGAEVPTERLTAPIAATTVKPAVESPTELSPTLVEDSSVSLTQPKDTTSKLNQANNLLAQQVSDERVRTTGSTSTLEQINRYSNSQDQVTNVSQLSDVSPGDWAYEALRSLVERYGCIAGYPDGTFRGNRATTRFEFAAGLNACLQQVERLIATSTEGFVTREDLETLQRLVQEFEAELATLGTRVDDLEGRVAFLEDHQFSTTTKLDGEVIFAINDLFGGEDLDTNFNGVNDSADDDFDDNTVFQDRVRLNFDTSFTGTDLLRIRLEAGNVETFPALGSDGITREGRLGFETNDTTNDVFVNDLYYRFPLADVATVTLFANGGNHYDYANLLNPGLSSSGTGAISRFGRFSPIYRTGAQGAGAAITIGPKSPIRIDLGYLTNEAADPSEGAGLVNGNYSALAQATFQPSKAFSIAATYVHSYDNDNLRHGTGSLTSQIEFAGGSPVVGNSYGVEASFAFTPQLILSGWGAYTDAIVIGRGGADVWTYGATLSINDFGTEGSTLGFVVGMEPKLTGSDATVGPFLRGSGGRRDDPDTGLHIEGFYKLRLTDNILITPGVIWLTAPGHNNDNDDIFVGTIRTTFTF